VLREAVRDHPLVHTAETIAGVRSTDEVVSSKKDDTARGPLFFDLESEMGFELAIEIVVFIAPPTPESPIAHDVCLCRIHHEADRPGEALPLRLFAD